MWTALKWNVVNICHYLVALSKKRFMWRRAYWVLHIWPSHVHQVNVLKKCKTPHLQATKQVLHFCLPLWEMDLVLYSCRHISMFPSSSCSLRQPRKKKNPVKQENCGFPAFCWWASELLSPLWPTAYTVHNHTLSYGHTPLPLCWREKSLMKFHLKDT